MAFRLTRVVRTNTSEIYLVWEDESRAAQVDVHYGPEVIHATVILEREFVPDEITSLIKQLDRDVVSSYLQDFERENLLVSVFRGDEVLTHSDEDDEEAEDEEFGEQA